MRRFFVLAILVSVPAFASTETERLVTLCRVWSTAQFLDPQVVFGSVDLDAALIRAIPRVRAAQSDTELAAAVGGMLAELHDPATHVVSIASETAADVPLYRVDGDAVIFNPGPYGAKHESIWAELGPVRTALKDAKALVVDLRYHGSDEERISEITYTESVLGGYATANVETPATEYVLHSGFKPEDGSTSGGYYSSLLTMAGTTISGAAKAPSRVVFVTDGRSPFPDVVLALHNAGKAMIVSSEPLDASAWTQTRSVPIGAGWRADVRIAVTRGTTVADLVSHDPMADALAYARGEKPIAWHGPDASSSGILEPHPRPAPEWGDAAYPDPEHRILAAFRLWSIIDSFYPYKSLIGDWNAVLPDMLPRFIAAKDADDYAAAVLEMAAHIKDGHTTVVGHPSIPKLLGESWAPITVRMVEGQFVITRSYGDAAALVHPGEIVLSVDGEPIATRAERFRRFVTASTEANLANRIAVGSPGTELEFAL